MTQTKSKAAPKTGAAAARDETAPEPKSFNWRGIDLELPDKLPATIAFDMVDIEKGGLAPLLGFLTRLLGDEQVQIVRAKLDDDGDALDELDEILTELMDGALSPFGLGLGES